MEDLKVAIKGKVYFPKYEGDTFTCAVAVDGRTEQVLSAKCTEAFGYALSVKDAKFHEDTFRCINVSSQFKVPVVNAEYDPLFKNGTKEFVDLYNGADVDVSLTIKPYEYRGRKGVTAYVRGVKLLSEVKEASYESMFTNLL